MEHETCIIFEAQSIKNEEIKNFFLGKAAKLSHN